MLTVDPIRDACKKLDGNPFYWNRLLAVYELDATMAKEEIAEVEAWQADREQYTGLMQS